MDVEQLTPKDQGEALVAIARALRRESHVLRRRPDIAWQQLANRLQWAEESAQALVEAERAERSAAGVDPWLRRRTPIREAAALRQVMEGHTDEVTGCAFSRDGALLASASDDRTVRLWDAGSGALVQVLEGHTDAVKGCAFSPDGTLLASAGRDGLRCWDARTCALVQMLLEDTEAANGCAFRPDGAQLAWASDDGMVRVWDARWERSWALREGHTDEAYGFAFVREGHPVAANECAFSPDGWLLASAGNDGMVRCWNARTGDYEEMSVQTGSVFCCTFSPDGALIASAGSDQTLCVRDSHLDARAAGHVHVLEGHTGRVRSCAFSPDGALLASASDDATVRLWEAHTDAPLPVWEEHTGAVRGCAFSPDGALLAGVGLLDRWTFVPLVLLWNVEQEQESPRRLEGYDCNGCAFSPDGAVLALTSDDGTVRLWDARTGSGGLVLKGHEGSVSGCGFSPDGGLLATAGDKTVRLWDAHSGALAQELEGHTEGVRACAFSPDGACIASAGEDGTLRLWDARTGSAGRVLEGHRGPVRSCAFGPDGALIASAGSDRTVRLWDASTGAPGPILEGHTQGVTGCAFTPDGTLLASASRDRTLRLWDASTGTPGPVLEVPAHLECIAFAPHRALLACGDQSGLVHRVEISGIRCGPLVVTAWERDVNLTVRCPACNKEFPIAREQLGEVIECPECGRKLRLNTFPITPAWT